MKHITNKSLHLFLVCSGPFKWPFYYLEHFKNVVYNFWGFAVSVHRTLCECLMTKKQTIIEKEKYQKVTKDTRTRITSLGTPVQLLITNISSANYMRGTQCI